MSTNLYVITNSTLTGNETQEDWENIVKQLKKLNIDTTSFVNANNEIIKEYGNWCHRVDDDEDDPLNVSFEGPFHLMPTLYSNIGVIDTIYKYRLLYEFKDCYWFASFRENLFNIVKIIGGTEVIYLADNGCNKLSEYLELMAWENSPYELIKQKMIKHLGNPITDYTKLEFDKLDYRNINEFFLDDFNDLKSNQISH